MNNRTPTRAEAIRRAIDNRLTDVYVALPGKVQKYDAAKQEANVIPQIKRVLRDGDGTRTTESLPVLPAVPVMFPAGNGFFLKFDLKKGDTVMVVIADRDVGNWIATGSDDPVDDRVHALNGACCFPVSFQNGGPSTTSQLAMGSTNGKQVHITPSNVNVGTANPTDAAALASKVNAVWAAFTTTTPGNADGGLALQTACKAVFTTTYSNDLSSATLKVDQ